MFTHSLDYLYIYFWLYIEITGLMSQYAVRIIFSSVSLNNIAEIYCFCCILDIFNISCGQTFCWNRNKKMKANMFMFTFTCFGFCTILWFADQFSFFCSSETFFSLWIWPCERSPATVTNYHSKLWPYESSYLWTNILQFHAL